ncbi:response regulator [Aestuariibacter sp. AA17]|uniref:Response regulator n=1 Tax=Fluctibacter corallii TaxID=2984329 RepID=A0ABT3A7I9_9ALTE|nr:response regulator [Aestuariibacter sp. AA17]MCV2884658.1 response regulator [Aestuariibacter sp. AA17]
MTDEKEKANHIVVLQTDAESDRLVIETLQKHFTSISVITKLKELCRQLVDVTPKVLLITGESVTATLSSYYRCFDAVKEYKVCDHRVVSLIPRQCEEDAYNAFKSGVIDDYLVSRPVYEVHRVVMICQHLLIELGVSTPIENKDVLFERYTLKYSDDLQSTLKRVVEKKASMKAAFETSLKEIETALDEASKKLEQAQPASLDVERLKAMLGAIKSDEIRPELLRLQEKALALLSSLFPQASEEETDTDDESTSEKTEAKQKPQFNQLYNQDIDPDEILKKAPAQPRVLLVEDDPISLQLTQRILDPYKIKVEHTSTGRNAFASLSSSQYDMVLMDINLPDTNGIYIVDQITSGDGPNANTPIIMLSGNKNKTTVAQAIERGAKGYIVKPLYKDSLVKLFTKYELPLKAKNKASQ